jgi:hypothetical protein
LSDAKAINLLCILTISSFLVRRGGVIGAVRNCCFDTAYHEMLLTDMDLLTRLLLPLAGPTPDSFDETEMETLPIDLQVLLCNLKIYG